jgi:hypothetical protein
MPDTPPGSLDPAIVALIETGWPDMASRLGDRREAFVARASEQAHQQGLLDANSAARYLNLCFAFGPAFETRPENEWALALLVDERLGNWVKLHQLARAGAEELARRGGESRQLLINDTRLLDALDRLAKVDGDDTRPPRLRPRGAGVPRAGAGLAPRVPPRRWRLAAPAGAARAAGPAH